MTQNQLPNAVVDHLKEATNIITIDGLRIEWVDGFCLIRASNTQPMLVLRCEGTTEESRNKIHLTMCELVRLVKPDANLSFGL